jgi:phage-related protein
VTEGIHQSPKIAPEAERICHVFMNGKCSMQNKYSLLHCFYKWTQKQHGKM